MTPRTPSHLRTLVWGALCCLCLLPGATLAQTACRQALALGLDVSGSVDAQEYRLQLDGLAAALGDAEVTEALLGQPGAVVRLMVFEWSSPGDERIIADWTDIGSPGDLTAFRQRLLSTNRTAMGPGTGLGHALDLGIAHLAGQSDCWRRTLDLSGDGKANMGRRPQDIRDTPPWAVVNGLVIGSDDVSAGDQRQVQIGELAAYYGAYVIRGPGAFVETAIGFEDYQEAMQRKLLRELASLAIGEARAVQ